MATIVFKIKGKEYPVENDPRRFTAAELNAVERYTGMTMQEWAERLEDRRVSSLAWTALAWVAMRRGGGFMRWDDFAESITLVEIFEGVSEPVNDTPPVA